MAGKNQTLPFPGDIDDGGALEPGDEVMPCANNIRTVNGERVHGPTQDLIFEMVQDDFNFREFRHGVRRGKRWRVE